MERRFKKWNAMNAPTELRSPSDAVVVPKNDRPTRFFLYRKCMYCGTVFGTTPCVEPMHQKFSYGICPKCALCAALAPLMAVEEEGE